MLRGSSRRCHEDATQKMVQWNLSFATRQSESVLERSLNRNSDLVGFISDRLIVWWDRAVTAIPTASTGGG